jgi:hypothetical protein
MQVGFERFDLGLRPAGPFCRTSRIRRGHGHGRGSRSVRAWSTANVAFEHHPQNRPQPGQVHRAMCDPAPGPSTVAAPQLRHDGPAAVVLAGGCPAGREWLSWRSSHSFRSGHSPAPPSSGGAALTRPDLLCRRAARGRASGSTRRPRFRAIRHYSGRGPAVSERSRRPPAAIVACGSDPSLRSVGNGLEAGGDFRSLAGVVGRRVPTARSVIGRVSRPRGSAWALRCRAFSGSPRARG